MNDTSTQACSPTLLARLRARAGAGRVVDYRDFSDVVLYAPDVGYYAREDAARVGRRPRTDFYTSSSLGGGIFGQLVRAAAMELLSPDSPGEYTLLEIAAERGRGIFSPGAAPFAAVEARSLGQGLLPPPKAAVFANEWLDAQPFHRLVFRRGHWRELGVNVAGPILAEVELPQVSPAARALLPDLPRETAEDYHVDISLDAESRLRELVAAPWRGGLMLADYGHDWRTLTRERPAGTARAYYRHEVSGDLLARAGEQDLTCHVCWDRLEKILREGGFSDIRVERQEAFFVKRAAKEIEKILSHDAAQFSPARQTLLELLHPAHLGGKFQILSARR